MAIWELLKDLNVDLTPETANKVLSKMDPEDLTAVRDELKEETKKNLEIKRSLDIAVAILDILIDEGLDKLI